MRSFIFFLILFALLGSGVYVTSQKLGFDFTSGEIAPTDQWSTILPGKWAFKTIMRNPREIWVFKGEAEYFPDRRFERYVTIKYYLDDFEPEIEDEDLGIVAGGSVRGTWQVDTTNGVWIEKISECQIINSVVENGCNENYDPCVWFQKGSSGEYGNYKSDLYKTELVDFTDNKIEINGKDFSEGGTDTRVFERR